MESLPPIPKSYCSFPFPPLFRCCAQWWSPCQYDMDQHWKWGVGKSLVITPQWSNTLGPDCSILSYDLDACGICAYGQLLLLLLLLLFFWRALTKLYERSYFSIEFALHTLLQYNYVQGFPHRCGSRGFY